MPRKLTAGIVFSLTTALLSSAAWAADLEVADPAPEAAAVAREALSPFKVRLRGVYVLTDNKGLVHGIPGSDLNYSNTAIPELDISYFFNENIAAELILGTTYANIGGAGAIEGLGTVGKTWLLPPTVTLQYHLTNFGDFKPYVGAGLNYTMFYDQTAKSADRLDIENSFGAALQVGFDYKIDDHWDFNFDVKKIFMRPDFDVTVGGTKYSGKAKIDPWLIGTGIGYRF